MKTAYLFLILCLGAVLNPSILIGQQIPISLDQIARSGFMNPGHFVAGDLHELHIGYRQRGVQVAGWRSAGQFLHFQSRPFGSTERFSWGLQVSNDHDHTENRMGMVASFAVKVLETDKTVFSLGGGTGLINWNSNYLRTRVYDRTEPLVAQGTNFFELDASMGAEFIHRGSKLRMDASVAGNQLSGSLLTNRLEGLNVLPHLLAGSSVLFAPAYNLFVGPRVFYRNTLNQRDTTLKAGTMDIGLRAEFDRQNLWLSSLYRIDQSAMTMGFGLQILKSDTARNPLTYGRFADLYVYATQPLQGGDAFGPSFELGLNMSLGKRGRHEEDTLSWARTFWKTEPWMTEHKSRYLSPIGPMGLAGSAQELDKFVYLDYSFPDINLRYSGEKPLVIGDEISKIGAEWEGVDGFLSGLVEYSVEEALHPDSTMIRDPENLEALNRLIWVEIGCEMRDDAEASRFGSGMVYEGEFGTNNLGGDTLFIKVVFDDKDTLVGVPAHRNISNLELACLKLYAMRGKLRYELEQRYGEEYRIEYEEDKLEVWEDEYEAWKPPLRIKKLRILSDRPNLQVFAENYVLLKFVRQGRFRPDPDAGWIPNRRLEEEAEQEDWELGGNQ